MYHCVQGNKCSHETKDKVMDNTDEIRELRNENEVCFMFILFLNLVHIINYHLYRL